jgi:hypothetical protein
VVEEERVMRWKRRGNVVEEEGVMWRKRRE